MAGRPQGRARVWLYRGTAHARTACLRGVIARNPAASLIRAKFAICCRIAPAASWNSIGARAIRTFPPSATGWNSARPFSVPGPYRKASTTRSCSRGSARTPRAQLHWTRGQHTAAILQGSSPNPRADRIRPSMPSTPKGGGVPRHSRKSVRRLAPNKFRAGEICC